MSRDLLLDSRNPLRAHVIHGTTRAVTLAGPGRAPRCVRDASIRHAATAVWWSAGVRPIRVVPAQRHHTDESSRARPAPSRFGSRRSAGSNPGSRRAASGVASSACTRLGSPALASARSGRTDRPSTERRTRNWLLHPYVAGRTDITEVAGALRSAIPHIEAG